MAQSAGEVQVEVGGLIRHLADHVGVEPRWDRERVVFMRELDLGEDELSIEELIDLPDMRAAWNRISALPNPVSFCQRPHPFEEAPFHVFLDLDARPALAELDRSPERLGALPSHAPESLVDLLPRHVALLDLHRKMASSALRERSQQVFSLDFLGQIDHGACEPTTEIPIFCDLGA